MCSFENSGSDYQVVGHHIPATLLRKHQDFNVNKNPTRCNSMQIFIYSKATIHVWVSQHPSSGVLKTVTAASGTGHNIGTAASLQRGLIGHFGGK